MAHGHSLEELERIASQASSLHDFLSHPEWVGQYYDALKRYTADTSAISHERYSKLISILRKTPAGIAERLWEPSQMGIPFTIEAAPQTRFGRDVSKSWKAHLNELTRAWQESLAGSSPKEVVESLRTMSRNIESHRAQLMESGLDKKAVKNQIRAQTRSEIELPKRGKPESQLGHAANWLLAKYFLQDVVLDRIRGNDADLVISEFEQFHESVKAFAIKVLPNLKDLSYLMAAIKRRAPSRQSLLSHTNWFPRTKRAEGSFRFVPSPRPFHTFWKSAPLAECICFAPGRMLSAVVRDTQFHFVEGMPFGKKSTAGTYMGWIQITPVQRGGSNSIYGSVDFGAPVLNRVTMVETPEGRYRTAFVNLWRTEAASRLPSHWKSMILGDANVDNTRVPGELRNSMAFILFASQLQGDPKEYDIVDTELKQAIGSMSNQSIFAKRYQRKPNSVLIDATIEHQNRLWEIPSQPLSLQTILDTLKARPDFFDFHLDYPRIPIEIELEVINLAIKALERGDIKVGAHLASLSATKIGTQGISLNEWLSSFEPYLPQIFQQSWLPLQVRDAQMNFFKNGGAINERLLDQYYDRVLHGDGAALFLKPALTSHKNQQVFFEWLEQKLDSQTVHEKVVFRFTQDTQEVMENFPEKWASKIPQWIAKNFSAARPLIALFQRYAQDQNFWQAFLKLKPQHQTPELLLTWNQLLDTLFLDPWNYEITPETYPLIMELVSDASLHVRISAFKRMEQSLNQDVINDLAQTRLAPASPSKPERIDHRNLILRREEFTEGEFWSRVASLIDEAKSKRGMDGARSILKDLQRSRVDLPSSQYDRVAVQFLYDVESYAFYNYSVRGTDSEVAWNELIIRYLNPNRREEFKALARAAHSSRTLHPQVAKALIGIRKSQTDLRKGQFERLMKRCEELLNSRKEPTKRDSPAITDA